MIAFAIECSGEQFIWRGQARLVIGEKLALGVRHLDQLHWCDIVLDRLPLQPLRPSTGIWSVRGNERHCF